MRRSSPARRCLTFICPKEWSPEFAQRYATALSLAGEARGVIVTAFEGRPIRIDGNPRHPLSLGAADVFTQAEILSLYDPDRSQAIRFNGEIADAAAFARVLTTAASGADRNQGEGLRLLTGRVSSPTLLDQIAGMLDRYPNMRWHVFEPSVEGAEQAALLAYGQPMRARPRFADADLIVAFDADPLGAGPFQVVNARGFADRRASGALRLYCAEGGFTLTGAAADERLAATPADCEAMLLGLAVALGASGPAPDLPPTQKRFVDAIVTDIAAHKGRAIVLAGESLTPGIGALALWVNDALQAPQDLYPIDDREQRAASLAELAADLRSDRVSKLVIVGSNPVQTAPGELDFATLLKRVPLSIHMGVYRDETAALCQWHAPEHHPLEGWSDAEGGGATSLVQPLIRPLYASTSAHELIATLSGEPKRSDYDRIRASWLARWENADIDDRWRQALIDGVIDGAGAKPVSFRASLPKPAPAASASALSLRLRPDPSWFDGRFANNAWLQECPRPFGKHVWGAPIALSSRDAELFNLSEGDEVELKVAGRATRGSVRIVAEQAAGVIEATLGGGRRAAGAIGDAVGFDGAALQWAASPFLIPNVVLAPTGRRTAVPSTAPLRSLGGAAADLAPDLRPDEQLPRKPDLPQGFNAPVAPPKGDPYAWGMVIDTGACIGCNACVIACQAENNIPVVGPEEVTRGRDMHWLRIDAYTHAETTKPRTVFQPVPCMHCETAPCEPVCPVEASVHDHEGLNVQVYNRCVGTRFCEANCPYKVRRFNFFGYADGQEYRNLGDPLVKAVNNPDVSVRARGVMEKCTYCVQRISRARRNAEKEMREISDGEVVTACQSACPTRAIHFGNLADPKSEVSSLRQHADNYTLLEQLRTRPRTTYLARRRNPNPALSQAPT